MMPKLVQLIAQLLNGLAGICALLDAEVNREQVGSMPAPVRFGPI
jgi:hypothetical protein